MFAVSNRELHAKLHNADWKKYNYTNRHDKFKKKHNECTIYIGNLPQNFLIVECLNFLQKIGKVYKIRMMNERCKYDCSNGYALATFYNSIDADSASEHFNNYEVQKGKKIKIILCRRQRQIIVHDVSMNMTDEQLLQYFSQTFQGLQSVTTMKYKRKSPLFDKENMGFAVLEFSSHFTALNARRFIGQKCGKFWGKYLIARWIEPGKAHRHVIITGISPSISESRLLSLLNKSSITGVVDYKWHYETLYVQFKSNINAEKAFKKLNGNEFEGKTIRLQWNVFPDS